MVSDKQMIIFPSSFNFIVSVLFELAGGQTPQHTQTINRFASGYCLAVCIPLCFTAETQMGPFWVCEREQLYHINQTYLPIFLLTVNKGGALERLSQVDVTF